MSHSRRLLARHLPTCRPDVDGGGDIASIALNPNQRSWLICLALSGSALALDLAPDLPIPDQLERAYGIVPTASAVLLLPYRQCRWVILACTLGCVLAPLVHPRQQVDGLWIGLNALVFLIATVQERQRRLTDQIRLRAGRTVEKLMVAGAGIVQVHELKQPVASLQLQLRSLLRQQEAGTQTRAPIQGQLSALLETTETLSNKLQAMQRLLTTDQEQPKQREIVFLPRLLIHCMASLRPQLQQANVKLERRGFEQPCWIRADREQLCIAVTNLLQNAIEAVALKPEPEQRRIRLSLENNGSEVRVKVEDSGPGLPCAEISDLLLRSSKPEGMGLGLQICKCIAAVHGGALEPSRSKELGGAKICLRFPI